MPTNKKPLSGAFIAVVLILGLATVGAVPFSSAQSGTNVAGVLTSDTVWSKAGSPYVFTGQVTVGEGATLTIGSGVRVDFWSYNLVVNGTLNARGSSNDRIVFFTSSTSYFGQRVAFSQSSKGWSDTDGSGCIIENAFFNLTTITIDSVSPKINGNSFSQPFGTPISISNGAPVISNNVIASNGSGISVYGGASVISNNSITLRGYGNGITATGDVSIFDNTISGGNKGITGNIRTVKGNVISGTQFGIDIQSTSGVRIEGNLIIRNTNGIYGISSGSLVQNNTIADNRLGIVGSRDVHTTETVVYNNLRNNETDIKSWNSNINAAYNWWGTTDTRVMNQSIHDVNDDQYLGKVSYIPFLTSPNPAAPAYDSLIQTQIQPLISNQSETNPSTTPNPDTSTKKPSTITVSCFTYSNRRVGISGTLTAGGTSMTGAFLLLSYSVDGGGTWTEIATVQTDDIGMFIATWVPSAGGNYRLKASWTGDSVYEGANATISLAITPFEEQGISSITSNSTLAELSFDPATRELTFSVSGPEGTTGYVKVCISKLLVSNISDLKVNLDQTPLAYAAESQGENWLVSFTYGASTHEVTMNLGSAPANGVDDQSGQWVAYGVAITAAAAVPALLFVRKRKTKKPNPTRNSA